MFSHPQPLLLHLHHVILFILGIIHLLQLRRWKRKDGHVRKVLAICSFSAGQEQLLWASSKVSSWIPMSMMFCSGQPLEPTRVLTADSVTASITVNRLQWFTYLKGETLPLLWKGPPALAHPTHRHHSYLSEITQLNSFFSAERLLMDYLRTKSLTVELKECLGIELLWIQPICLFPDLP